MTRTTNALKYAFKIAVYGLCGTYIIIGISTMAGISTMSSSMLTSTLIFGGNEVTVSLASLFSPKIIFELMPFFIAQSAIGAIAAAAYLYYKRPEEAERA